MHDHATGPQEHAAERTPRIADGCQSACSPSRAGTCASTTTSTKASPCQLAREVRANVHATDMLHTTFPALRLRKQAQSLEAALCGSACDPADGAMVSRLPQGPRLAVAAAPCAAKGGRDGATAVLTSAVIVSCCHLRSGVDTVRQLMAVYIPHLVAAATHRA
jgi:hypothetical protein